MTAFNTGMAHMQNAIEEGKRRQAAATSGGSSKALNYINWKPGDKKIVRFLTDDVMTEEFLEFIVDKGGNTRNFMIPPGDKNILDRYRAPEGDPRYPLGWRKNPKTGAIEEPKARKIGIGLAVLREEKEVDGKYVVEDYLYEEQVDGVSLLHRHYGIIQQSISNFWHTLAVSCFKRFGTICDRDYEITREGNGLDTKYSIIPLPEPDPDLASIEAVHDFYFYGKGEWDDNDPERFLKCPQTLTQWAEYFGSEDRYKFWLTPDGSTPAGPSYSPSSKPSTPQTNPLQDGDEAQSGPAPTAAPVTGTSFSSFKENIINKAKSQS